MVKLTTINNIYGNKHHTLRHICRRLRGFITRYNILLRFFSQSALLYFPSLSDQKLQGIKHAQNKYKFGCFLSYCHFTDKTYFRNSSKRLQFPVVCDNAWLLFPPWIQNSSKKNNQSHFPHSTHEIKLFSKKAQSENHISMCRDGDEMEHESGVHVCYRQRFLGMSCVLLLQI